MRRTIALLAGAVLCLAGTEPSAAAALDVRSPAAGSILEESPTVTVVSASDELQAVEVRLRAGDATVTALLEDPEDTDGERQWSGNVGAGGLPNGPAVVEARPVSDGADGDEAAWIGHDVVLDLDPPAPQVAVELKDGAVELTWTVADLPDLTGFQVARAPADGDFTEVAQLDADATSWRDDAPEPGDQRYRVTAVRRGAADEPRSASTVVEVTVPAAEDCPDGAVTDDDGDVECPDGEEPGEGSDGEESGEGSEGEGSEDEGSEGEGSEDEGPEGEGSEGAKDGEGTDGENDGEGPGDETPDGGDGGKSEGGKSEGGKSEGGKTEGGKSEGGKTGGGKSEGGKTEGGKSEGGKSEGGKSEGGKSGGGKSEGGKTDDKDRSGGDTGTGTQLASVGTEAPRTAGATGSNGGRQDATGFSSLRLTDMPWHGGDGASSAMAPEVAPPERGADAWRGGSGAYGGPPPLMAGLWSDSQGVEVGVPSPLAADPESLVAAGPEVAAPAVAPPDPAGAAATPVGDFPASERAGMLPVNATSPAHDARLALLGLLALLLFGREMRRALAGGP